DPASAADPGNMTDSTESAVSTDNPTGDLSEASRVRFRAADEPGSEDLEPDLTPRPEDARSQGQKMHDSLMLIAQMAGQAAEMPTQGGAPVTVLIQTTQAELAASLARDIARADQAEAQQSAGRGGTHAGGGCTSTGVQGRPERVGAAWLHGADGVPVPVGFAAVRHSMCAGATQRVLVGETGRILGLESPARLFTAVQRRAITARDGGCVIPGCTVPGAWCEVHHVTGWAAGGKTTTENGVLLCWWHHRSVEAGGWHVRMVAGLPEVRGPRWWDPGMVWRPARSVWAVAMEHVAGRAVPGQQRRPRTG
ncbi:HNH endonuclease signature motif containing protein, partial [Leucobacter sp. HY1908]